MSTAPAPGIARPRWPAPARQEERPRKAPDLLKLEQLIDQVAASIGPADRGELARALERCLGKLLARMDSTPGDERLRLNSGLVLANYNVEAWARLTAKKLRGSLREAIS